MTTDDSAAPEHAGHHDPAATATSGRVSVAQHRADVAALLAPRVARRPLQTLTLAEALDRVLGADVVAPVPVPAFRNSQMDGFAVRAADVVEGVALRVVGEVAARPGTPDALAPGTAARIMTGAPVPDGADAVVPVEDTSVGRFRGAPPTEVVVRRLVQAREFVREAGSDVGAGTVVLPAGTRLGPAQLAAAAACGVAEVEVVVPLRVSIVSTGAELVAPGEPLRPGQVYDANTAALSAAVRAAGGTVVFEGRCGDDPRVLASVLADAAALGDLVITSGGVSQGAYEVVKDVLAPGSGDLPVSLRETAVEFRTVAMQPGGPQGFGRFRGTPILTFPGNPVSAQVSFVVFARELVAAAAGRVAGGVPVRHRLLDAVGSPAGKRQMLRGALAASGGVHVVGGPGSHLVASMARADVLIDVPEDVTALAVGDEVEVWEL